MNIEKTGEFSQLAISESNRDYEKYRKKQIEEFVGVILFFIALMVSIYAYSRTGNILISFYVTSIFVGVAGGIVGIAGVDVLGQDGVGGCDSADVSGSCDCFF